MQSINKYFEVKKIGNRNKLFPRDGVNISKVFDYNPDLLISLILNCSEFRIEVDSSIENEIHSSNFTLRRVSKEVKSKGLKYFISSKNPDTCIKLLNRYKLVRSWYPDIYKMKGIEERDGFTHKDVFFHSLEVLKNISSKTDKFELRLSALLHDIGKIKTKEFVDGVGWTYKNHAFIGSKMIPNILKNFGLDKNIIEYVSKMVKLHMRPMILAKEEVTDSAIRRLITEAGDDLDDLMILVHADVTTKDPDKEKECIDNYEYTLSRISEVKIIDKIRNFDYPINGHDIMEKFDIQPSDVITEMKLEVRKAILNNLIANDKNEALSYLESIWKF